ncbi:MAG: 5-formyltetrahydrofolate cyclo-ligase [Candidatus Hadarchaeum sp.]|uniref:5-formyltetrahydrofolate cyclo-ligase n=1 Tax=Candidatus Hadarchaeum sp. TaxID=2883567 RepID=UPI003D14B8ED
MDKQSLRERVWRELEASGAAAFPKPIRGRIPSFVGSREAARQLGSLPEYLSAEVIFVNPDAAQLPVREMALRDGKRLLMATPKLRHGFLLIEPAEVVDFGQAATIRGAFGQGKMVSPKEIKVDLIVEGSVAVDRRGGRLGKGGGYGDLEFAILRELGAVSETTPIATTVHPLQIVEEVPMTVHDVPVDYILNPDQVIRTARGYPRPQGIDWDLLPPDALKRMPLLAELRREHDHGSR